ncbi:hypothetical protein [Amycolatopsis tolypomycina]|uniref:hypothetical protein n=1 Tax=Amycolatopsis tolypomycina TaxID=208445 RepID=UPI0033B35F91
MNDLTDDEQPPRIRGYRDHAPPDAGKRKARTAVLYTDIEWAAITVAAAADGMRPGAWVAQIAYNEARRANAGDLLDGRAIAELRAELRQHRRVLTNIGGNINDVARVANSTGALEHAAQAAAVLRLVRNVVQSSDQLVEELRTRFAA